MTENDTNIIEKEKNTKDIPIPQIQRQIFEELKKKGLPNIEGTTCFLINLKWWNIWMNYIGIKVEEEEEVKIEFIEANGKEEVDSNNNSQLVKENITVPPIDNQSLFENNRLKPNLLENVDYVIVSTEIWNYLVQWYGGGPPIERNIISVGINKSNAEVEIYPFQLTILKFDYFLTPRSEEYNYEPPPKRLRSNLEIDLEASKNTTVKQILEAVAKKLNHPPHKSQFWKEKKDGNFEIIKPINITLEDALVGCTNRLIFETQFLNDWKDVSEVQKFVSEFDRKTGIKKSPSITSSDQLPLPQLNHSHLTPYHSNSSKSTSSSIWSSLGPRISYQKGIVGLENLGNTCFMNASLQCLNATVPLTEYFLSDKHLNDINTNNPLGMQGKMANFYGYLLKKIWAGNSNCVDPSEFKWILGKFAPQFSGYRQHDSQELLAFLLDGLHEDLNKVLDKPSVETFEANGKNDDDAAAESWRRHLLRNQSIIVDLFQGQLKSTLVCPCENTSVTFDPFMFLSLPIPSLDSRIFTILFFKNTDLPIPLKFQVTAQKKGRVFHIIEQIAEKLNIKRNFLRAAQLHFSNFQILFENDYSISSIHSDELAVYEIPPYSTTFRMIYRQNGLLYGYPFLLNLSSPTPNAPTTGAMLYEATKNRIKDFFPNSSSIENFFVLKSVSMNGYDCRECISRICKGCPIPNEPVPLKNKDVNCVAIEFSEPVETSLFSKYQIEPNLDNQKAKKDHIGLFDCLNHFLKKEKLGPEDAWYCPKCKQFQQATKQFQLYTLPQILVIHLKRFQYTKFWREKVDVLVDYPLSDCDFGPYLLNHRFNSKYRLFAISVHSGSLGGGHYTAYCRHEEQWYYFSDGHFDKVPESRVSNIKDAYVLFYRRIEN